jgi:hypothetical protein
MNDLKAQYQMDVESGYPEPWELWKYKHKHSDDTCFRPCGGEPNWRSGWRYMRLPNADQIILDWQRQKYQEDCEWHPEPWTLWQYKPKRRACEWEVCAGRPFWENKCRYRRRPDAPTKEEWEAGHCKKCGEKWDNHDMGVPAPICPLQGKTVEQKINEYFDNVTPEQLSEDLKKAGCVINKCATCRHTTEAAAQTWLDFFKQWRADQ